MRAAGFSLATALVLLTGITVLAAAAVKVSTLQQRMSGNDELRVVAFERAQSVVDAAIAMLANTALLPVGAAICARGCAGSVALPAEYSAELAEGAVNVTIRALPPERGPPPAGSGFSADRFAAAALRVEGEYDRAAQGQGYAQVREGLAIVFAAPREVFTTRDPGS